MTRVFVFIAAVLAAVSLVPLTASGSVPTHPRWESSARQGAWTHGGYLFQNDMWNCPQRACGRQTIWANSASDWGVVSDMRARNTAVLTYPNIGNVFNHRLISSFSVIRNRFSESTPRHARGLSAEVADDVWLDNYKIEVMIWVDNVGRSLAGSRRIGTARVLGQEFSVWTYGGSEFIFALNHNEASGQTDILSSVEWLIHRHRVPSTATIDQAEFGWEIASTGGHPLTFQVTGYSLQTRTR